MTRAVGNGMIQMLANAIGTGAVGKLVKQVAGLSTDVANIKTPDKGSGLMFNPDTGKLYIPCGNGVTVNKNTGMLEVPIGEHLRYTGSGLDVPDADETTAGVVKLTHEVSNRDDGEWAVTADGVYAYAPGYKTKPSVLEYSDTASGFYVVWGFYIPGIIIMYLSTAQTPTYTANDPLIILNGYNTDVQTVRSVDGTDFKVSNSGSNLVFTSSADITTSIDICVFIPAYKI